jgi:hypothetical protein
MAVLEKYRDKLYKVQVMGKEHYLRAYSYDKEANLIRFGATEPIHPQVGEYTLSGIMLVSPEMFETAHVIKVFEFKHGKIIVHPNGDEEFQALVDLSKMF